VSKRKFNREKGSVMSKKKMVANTETIKLTEKKPSGKKRGARKRVAGK
jgi:hypothetical protein